MDLDPTAVDPLAVEAVGGMDQDQVAVDHQPAVPLVTVGGWLRFWGLVVGPGIIAGPGNQKSTGGDFKDD